MRQQGDDSLIRLWLVEDSDEIRVLLARLLNIQAGIHCLRSFASSESMLNALGRETPPDLILSDLNLPGRSGIEAISEVRALSPTTRVLIMTTFYDPTAHAAAVAAGAAGFLAKPCEMTELTRIIQQVCAEVPPAAAGPAEVKKAREPELHRISLRGGPASVPWGVRAFGILRALIGAAS